MLYAEERRIAIVSALDGSIESMHNGAAARMPTPCEQSMLKSPLQAIRSANSGDFMSRRVNGQIGGYLIMLRSHFFIACSKQVAPVKRSILHASI